MTIPDRDALFDGNLLGEFLARHDPVYETPPLRWDQGLPLGNGDLGIVIWGSGNPLILTLDKTDIWEKRHWKPDSSLFKWREFRKLIEAGTVEKGEKDFQRPRDPGKPYPTRVPVGRVELQPVGKVVEASMRLILWDATGVGCLVTDRGKLCWKAFVHAREPLIVFILDSQADEKDASFSILPYNDPNGPAPSIAENLKAWGYPPVRRGGRGGVNFWSQTIPEGGEYAVAWCVTSSDSGRRILWLSIAHTYGGPGADQKAVDTVNRLSARDVETLHKEHREWWRDYYPASFLSVPDTCLEALYWIEMYKLASCTRPDRPPLALHGPWSQDGKMPPWSGDYHWNINVEMTYWPIYTANRLEFGAALYEMIDRARPQLGKFCRDFLEREGEFLFHATDIEANPVYDWASGQFEFNGLAWVAHHYWLHWRYSQDREFLRKRAFPLMKEALRPYLDELTLGEDGRLHLPWGFSPEYRGNTGKGYWGPDCTCDLAFINFLCKGLLESCAEFGMDDLEKERWEETSQKLTAYPTDRSGGLAVRGDLELETSHRHHSHLIPLHPLHLLSLEKDRELIERTIKRWIFQGHGEWVGFSVAWAASIAACTNRANLARTMLLDYVDRWVTENTFHMQGPQNGCDLSVHGNYALTLEAGFGAANALQEMLLQSYDGVIRAFPAVPRSWTEAAFWSLRAEGAFLVSAVRRNSRTVFVHIVSEAGGPCRVRVDFDELPVLVSSITGPKKVKWVEGDLFFETLKGEQVLIWSGETQPECHVVPCQPNSSELNFFGVKRVPRF